MLLTWNVEWTSLDISLIRMICPLVAEWPHHFTFWVFLLCYLFTDEIFTWILVFLAKEGMWRVMLISRQKSRRQRTQSWLVWGLLVPPSCSHALFIGTEPYRFLPEENGVQDGQRARNSSPVALASCLLVGKDLGSCHRTVLNFGGGLFWAPNLGCLF